MYKNQIVHVVIGNLSYAGELDQGEHPNGKDWLRINEPCIVHIAGSNITIAKVAGTVPIYRPYVDIRIPRQAMYRVHMLDKAGILYQSYMNEIKRKAPENIIIPGQEASLRVIN